MKKKRGWLGSDRVRILLLAAYLLLIFFLSSRPHLAPPPEFVVGDKLAHLVEYWILGWLTAALIDPSGARRASSLVVMVAGAGLLVGAADELVQSRVAGREASIYDLLADGVGALAAAGVWCASRHRLAGQGG